jgi:RNA polymerase sigma factor (TIGR02999 family)
MSEVTRHLEAAQTGDCQAAAELLPLVYDELRKLAAARMAVEVPAHTLQPTALVHEAYLRLVGDQRFEGCSHFFAAAAEAMRRILIDAARRKHAEVHGGGRQRFDLEDADLFTQASPDRLCALDDALAKLEIEDAQAASLVKLRLYAGLGPDEAAAALGVSRATGYRPWAYARAWLRAELADR